MSVELLRYLIPGDYTDPQLGESLCHNYGYPIGEVVRLERRDDGSTLVTVRLSDTCLP